MERRQATIPALVDRLGEHGDRPALVAGDRSVDFSRLASDAKRLGNALHGLGVRRGDSFSFSFPNGIEMALCYLACGSAGIVGVPLSQRVTESELAYQLRDSGATGIACDEAFAELLDGVRPQAPELRLMITTEGSAGVSFDDLIASGTRVSTVASIAESDPFCVMYTGGTTGDSKAAIQTHESWVTCVETVAEEWRLTREDRHLAMLPMSHVAWFTILAQLYAGGSTHILGRWGPREALELIAQERITTTNMIPTMLGDLVEACSRGPEVDLSSLRLLTVAGSAMPEDLFHRARAAFGPIIGNIYGMTESSGPVTYLRPEDMVEARIRSGGRPGRHVEIAILDETGAHVHAGSTGEIVLAGPQITPGYLNQEEETTRAFKDGWFLTGDVGFIDQDGFVFIVDRLKDMIKSGGFNVYPKEIEEVLYTHPEVVEAAVFGLADPKWIEAVHAAVVVREGSVLTEHDLRAYCRDNLAAYKIPKGVHFEERLPRTVVGKFDKRKLRSKYAAARMGA